MQLRKPPLPALTVKLSKYNVDDVALGVCKTGAEEAGVTEVRRSEERFSRNAETDLVCRLLLEKKNHRPKTPQPKPWRVTSLSGPTVTSLSAVYTADSRNGPLWNVVIAPFDVGLSRRTKPNLDCCSGCSRESCASLAWQPNTWNSSLSR